MPQERIEAFCRKWKVKELALFGSVITEDFRPDSDIDIMVVFQEGALPEDWHQLLVERRLMRQELRDIFIGRKIDLVEKKNITNQFIRYHALTHKLVIYASG